MRTARASGAPPDDRRPPWPRPRNLKYEVANAQYGGVPEREGRFVQFSLYRPSMAAYYGQATVPKTRFEFPDLDDRASQSGAALLVTLGAAGHAFIPLRDGSETGYPRSE